MNQHLTHLSNCIRFLSMDMVQQANSGHPGLPMGMADVATILFKNHLNFHPFDPKWANRDRLILSAGHGSALLYSLLYLTGYSAPTINDLKSFRQLHSPCAGHPEYGYLDGIETTTGPLGQGVANAIGMAIAQKKHQIELNLTYKIYAIVSDGDLMEGISHEACALAGHLKLNNLVLLFDDNSITIDGPTNLSTSEDPLDRFKSYGFDTLRIDGHDFDAIDNALTQARKSEKPFIIACKTIIGKGAPNKQGKASAHGSPLGAAEIKLIRENEKWTSEPFVIPEEYLNEWRSFYKKSEDHYHATKHISLSQKTILSDDIFADLKQAYHNEKPNKATRILFQEVLDKTTPSIPYLIGGAADLTPSNNTKVKDQGVIKSEDFSGSYLHFGIREHGMAGIMNGLALSGFLPYGGTFLVFSDYMRPAMRLSAIMKQQVFYIMTHDSIGLGEDGPTHQPIEHLCALRAIPNLLVFRPCDAVEMVECWQTALTHTDKPSVFALSRQSLPYLRFAVEKSNLSHKGAYILSHEDSSTTLDITLVATGSEVQLCSEAKKILVSQGKNVRVVSMPCVDLFQMLSDAEKNEIIGSPKQVIAIEASIGMSLRDALSNFQPSFIGLNKFGGSAPAEDLFNFFKITLENIVATSN
jgi:transketolase